MQHLKPILIRKEKYADYLIRKGNGIPILKKNSYCVVPGYSIGGDAPKSFIRVYEYKKNSACRKAKPSSWSLYIAKTGDKWYPLESITEHLIARIGAVIGLNMAETRLVIADGQVKFLSKFFTDLDKGQELVHGIDILAAHLGDKTFTEQIALQKREREFFTLEDTVEAIKQLFSDEHIRLLEDFFLMLCFDAWVGVQDRHFQNWGIVRNAYGKHKPYFSPIYDSARGLFWNFQESRITEWATQNQFNQQIFNQVNKSMPQLSLARTPSINHFELVKEILSDRFIPFKSVACRIFTDERLRLVQKMVIKEFSRLLSRHRIDLILKCLEIRHNTFNKLLQ